VVLSTEIRGPGGHLVYLSKFDERPKHGTTMKD